MTSDSYAIPVASWFDGLASLTIPWCYSLHVLGLILVAGTTVSVKTLKVRCILVFLVAIVKGK